VRLVQVVVPAGKREAVLAALDEDGVDYVVTEETSGREYTAVVSFPLPKEAVEPVLEHLREVGVERSAYTVVVAAETVASEHFEELKEQYAEENDEDRIAREELTARAEDLAPGTASYVLLTLVSVVVATAGILLDSPATVVGSMVIAPLVGPAIATAVGTVVDEQGLFRRGVYLQVVGVLVAILGATAFASLVRAVAVVPPGLEVTALGEVEERVAPDFLSLVVALGAGVAGAHSVRSGVSTALVGVMIAVALVPPTAVVGIGLAWGLPAVAVGAALLALVNALSINLATLVTLWRSGYRPEQWFRTDEVRGATLKRAGALALAVAVLSVALVGVTVGSYQRAVTEEAVRADVDDALAERDLRATDLHLTFADRTVERPLSTGVERVVVTVGHPPGEPPPSVARGLRGAVADDAPNAAVEVRFVAVETAQPSNGSSGS
jgi:uncharacterized hydrophobic protein (TIGR00341 family)